MAPRADTYQKVMTALQKLARTGVTITVKAVAKQAGVARATLYNNVELLELVQSFEMQQHFENGYAEGHRAGQNSSAPSRQSASEEWARGILRSEEHTSELQSLRHLVCRL